MCARQRVLPQVARIRQHRSCWPGAAIIAAGPEGEILLTDTREGLTGRCRPGRRWPAAVFGWAGERDGRLGEIGRHQPEGGEAALGDLGGCGAPPQMPPAEQRHGQERREVVGDVADLCGKLPRCWCCCTGHLDHLTSGAESTGRQCQHGPGPRQPAVPNGPLVRDLGHPRRGHRPRQPVMVPAARRPAAAPCPGRTWKSATARGNPCCRDCSAPGVSRWWVSPRARRAQKAAAPLRPGDYEGAAARRSAAAGPAGGTGRAPVGQPRHPESEAPGQVGGHGHPASCHHSPDLAPASTPSGPAGP
jgi:hypothetical protein